MLSNQHMAQVLSRVLVQEALRLREVESRAANENGIASAEKTAALRKRLEREKAVAVQEAEAKWRERHDNFKRESVAVLAHSASSLEVQSTLFFYPFLDKYVVELLFM